MSTPCPNCGEPLADALAIIEDDGACPECEGLGTAKQIAPELVVPHPEKTINEGALAPLGEPRDIWIFNQLEAVAEAYDFDGVDDYVSLLDLSLSSASSFSIALWVNLDATGDQRFLGRYDGSADLLEFGINSDSNFFANLGHAGGSTLRPVGTGVAGSTWVMVTLVYDASGPSATIYQNDTQDASDSGSLNDFADGSGPDIGRRSDGGSHVDGRIDDPRLYDKALSSTEVSNLYNNGDIRG